MSQLRAGLSSLDSSAAGVERNFSPPRSAKWTSEMVANYHEETTLLPSNVIISIAFLMSRKKYEASAIVPRFLQIQRELVQVAMRQRAADVIFLDGNLINVNVGYVQTGMTVVCYHGFIAYVGTNRNFMTDSHTQIVDCHGKFLAPGLIDTHTHCEVSLLTPEHYILEMLAKGVTTVCLDNHEIVNVFGLKAMDLFQIKGLPSKVYWCVPVCVPSIPGYEDTGGTIRPDDVARAYTEGWADIQGEMMNFPGITSGLRLPHEILAVTHQHQKVAMGHYPSPDYGQALNAYIASGIRADHEGTTKEGTSRRLELGLYAQLRHSTWAEDLPRCVRAVTEGREVDSRLVSFVTDDISALSVLEKGGVAEAVRVAVRAGVTPIKAIQMATLNAAQLLKMARYVGSISPGRCADILIVSDLSNFHAEQVWANGELVSRDEKLVVVIPERLYPQWSLKSIHLPDGVPLTAKDFEIRLSHKLAKKLQHGTDLQLHNLRCKARVITIVPGMLETKKEIVEIHVPQGVVSADPAADLMKLFVFHRYPEKENVPQKAYCLVRGTGIPPDCAFASTVGHDSHNLTVVGCDAATMAAAANGAAEAQGGFAAARAGRLIAVIPLPLGGLMSLETPAVVHQQLAEVENVLGGVDVVGKFVFLSLVVLPELHLSNRGLVDISAGYPVFVEPFFSPDEEPANVSMAQSLKVMMSVEKLDPLPGIPAPVGVQGSSPLIAIRPVRIVRPRSELKEREKCTAFYGTPPRMALAAAKFIERTRQLTACHASLHTTARACL